MKRALFRLLIVFGALVYCGSAARQMAGQHALQIRSNQALEHALRWNPGNAQLWMEMGRARLASIEAARPAEAAAALRHAIRLNPLEPDAWELLATAHQMNGEAAGAGAAVHAGLLAVPHSPTMAWRFANFLILQGRSTEATPYLRVVATQARGMRRAVYNLGWKIQDDPAAILRDIVPAEPVARADYLEFLITQKRLAEGYPVWQSLRGSGPLAVEEGTLYVDRLAVAGRGLDAARVWDELLQDTGRRDSKPPEDAVTDGDFEANLTNAGLDWRVTPAPGFDVTLDNFELRSGSRSLRVSFDGTQNLEFAHVWQLAAVKPGARYRFSAQMKTEGLTTTSGVKLCVSAFGEGTDQSVIGCTSELTGSEPWKRQEFELIAPSSGVVRLELRRARSTKLNNLLAGKAWIDAVSLKAE